MTCKKNLKASASSFCETTTLHGFRYIPGTNKYKSFVWCSACTFSALFCCYLIILQMDRYYLKRINTSIETTGYPIWQVEFPAVTICNVNSVYKANTKNISDLLKRNRVSDDMIEAFFEDLPNMIIRDETEINTNMDKYYQITKALERNGYNSDILMKELAHPCKSMVKNCKWFGQEYNCTDIFQLILTSEGYCCSFNYNGQVAVERPSEKRVSYGVGAFFGLQLNIDMEESQYISNASSGVNVLIHENYVYPMMSLHGISVFSGNDITVTMKPEVLISDNEIRDLHIEQRACLFDNEVYLGVSKWAPRYSFLTCTRESYADVIVQMCGCLPFYLPYSETSQRYCNLLDSFCLQRNRLNFTNLANSKIMFTEHSSHDHDTFSSHCYPECDEVSHNIHIDNHKNTHQNQNATVIRIYYRSIGVTKISRSLSLTWDSLLASIGGTFGLCLGGSVLSIVEFVYIIVVNMCRREKKRQKNVVSIYFNELLGNNYAASNRVTKICNVKANKFAPGDRVKSKRFRKGVMEIKHNRY